MRNLILKSLVLLVCLVHPAACQERFLTKISEWYPSLTERRSQELVVGYLGSLEFDQVMLKPKTCLSHRREWNSLGYEYTPFLIDQWSRKEQRYRTALLLGGTHDDRAAVALVQFLKDDPELDVRLAIYSALAELGYYTDYHARLLLAEHERRWPLSPQFQKGRGYAGTTVRLLCNIHHPEAVWAQDQLRARHLVDGAVAEEEYPLLEFRDYALGRGELRGR